MTNNRRPRQVYQRPPDTVIDLAMRADIRGVQNWLNEHPEQLNDILENGEKTFKGTLLHAAAYSGSQKWQPVYGPIKSIFLTHYLLKQAGINPTICDATGKKPRRAHLYPRSIVISDDRLERHKDKNNSAEKYRQAVIKENKERVQYGGKAISPRREKVFIIGSKVGNACVEGLLSFALSLPLPLMPVIVLSRICTSMMVLYGDFKHQVKPARSAALPKRDGPH